MTFAPLNAYADLSGTDKGRKDNSYEKRLREYEKWRGYSEKQKKRALKDANKKYRDCLETAVTAADRERCGNSPTLATCAELEGCQVVDPREVAREVIAELRFPDATPVFGPDPGVNKVAPGKLVVGFPYWLTVAGDESQSSSATSQGLTLRLDARRTKVVYEMGDGTALTCAATAPWPGEREGFDRRGEPKTSPVCGHVFTRTGEVVIRSTVYWDVTWHGGGMSGVESLAFSDQVVLDVVELHTVVR